MKTLSAVPYLLPLDSAVRAHPWITPDGSQVSDRMDHWDPFTDLELLRIIEVDLDAVRDDCQLPGDAAFALVPSWFSNRTRIAGPGAVVELGQLPGVIKTSLSVKVPGADVGGWVSLRTRLVVRHLGEITSPLSARRLCSILWNDEFRIILEGAAARFPTTAVDFKTSPHYPDTAAWLLEWDHNDLDAPVLGGMRLLVNSGHEPMPSLLRSGSADPRAPMLRSFVTFDIARELVTTALGNDQFVREPERFDDGTIGRMIFELITLCWPGAQLSALRARFENDFSRVSAELQAKFGVAG